MKILIELYDKEPIYNYLAACVFTPDRVYFVGNSETSDKKCRLKTEKFARLTGIDAEFRYISVESVCFDGIRSAIEKIIDAEKKDGNKCIIDVTGGSDLALVAAGSLIGKCEDIVRYDNNRGDFRMLSCNETRTVNLGIPCEAFIAAAGGTVYEKTRSMNFTDKEWQIIRRIISVFFDNCDNWTKFVKYLQRVSKKEGGKIGDSLFIDAPLNVAEGGKNYSCNKEILSELEKCGAVKNVRYSENNVEFTYASSEFAVLLANEGVWLELSVYLTAKNMTEVFDAQTGVKFVWDIPDGNRNINSLLADSAPRNEVDVVLSCGVEPVFISCKTRMPTNEDLNELYAIKDNFGGELAIAIMATTKYVDINSPVYERAKAMGIGMIDERNFKGDTVAKRLRKLGVK